MVSTWHDHLELTIMLALQLYTCMFVCMTHGNKADFSLHIDVRLQANKNAYDAAV